MDTLSIVMVYAGVIAAGVGVGYCIFKLASMGMDEEDIKGE